MLSLTTAIALKQAGLKWMPAKHDYFVIPERGLDQHVFVISDMTVAVEMYGGYPVVTFNGASEWALDYVTLREVVWLPREDQLRLTMENLLHLTVGAGFELISIPDGYRVLLIMGDSQKDFRAQEVSEAYARALLYLLDERPTDIARG